MPKKKHAGSNDWVDLDDAPELTDDYFERADVYEGERLVRRGRPPSENPKKAISLRVDAEVLERFKATGPGWQRRMNAALRKAVGL
ncbi:BrnA antitoxin family protein [Chelativorans sp. AA-79]|uniref:BrnA antitoxin family protein n=1 Tax=Chelativorans sp. AA-79 TaxID=3028735 RepID=UPI0023F90C2E|nr:BrnA antitoxin family protein [Chelativorans sp. AA-79]WEX11307.1 BrnA antitoxin family protein [Chelativorans sp. AA-79]